MNIQGLDHFTIRTSHLPKTLKFYVEVIGLREAYRPAFKFIGHWLYVSDKPVLHLVGLIADDTELQSYLGRKSVSIDKGSGSLDHIAFRGNDLTKMQKHLLKLNVNFRERVVPEIGEHQLFIEDPNGITVELIFPYSNENSLVGTTMENFTFDKEVSK